MHYSLNVDGNTRHLFYADLRRIREQATPGPLTGKYDRKGYYATGTADDLMEAAPEATRSLVASRSDHDRSPEDAYSLLHTLLDVERAEGAAG